MEEEFDSTSIVKQICHVISEVGKQGRSWEQPRINKWRSVAVALTGYAFLQSSQQADFIYCQQATKYVQKRKNMGNIVFMFQVSRPLYNANHPVICQFISPLIQLHASF